ncbi:MAG: hypothetical protein ABWZ16_04165 [Microbacterium sp.]
MNDHPPTSVSDRPGLPRWATAGAVIAIVLAALFVSLAWSAIRSPNAALDVDRTGAYSYRLTGDFKATAAPSTVYPSGSTGSTVDEQGRRVAAGPLYTQLIQSLHVDILTELRRTGSARDVPTTLDGNVTVRTPEGWSHVVDVLPQRVVDGSSDVTAFDVDLPAIRKQVADIAAQTGVGGQSFTVSVDAVLTVDPGDAAGNEATGVDIGRISVDISLDGNVTTVAPITPSTGNGVLGNRVTRAASISAFGVPVRVDAARIVFPGLALVAIGIVAVFGFVLFGGYGLTGPTRIAARYRTRIVDVAMTTAPGPVVLVSSMGELARIAKAEQTVILHEALGDGSHRYRVVLGAVTYEYHTVPEHAGLASDLLGGEDGPA